ncbi:MAG: hypothetical protein ACI9R3_002632, partial [Verrucomicrobiales bacterium]
MKKLSKALALGVIGLCLLGLFVWGWLAPQSAELSARNLHVVEDVRSPELKPSYAFESTGRAGGGVVTVNNMREVKATIDPSTGILVEPISDAEWSCRIQLTGVGRVNVEQVKLRAPSAEAAQLSEVEYAGSAGDVELTEWFKSGVHGVEQGWTLKDAPEHELQDGGEPLKMRLAVASDLLPQMTDDRKTLVFREASAQAVGAIALRYQNLKAFDANGKAVPAWFEIPEVATNAGAVDIMVADAGAVYPLTVDPCFAADSAVKQFGDDTDDFDSFGHAIAVSGNWAAISAPDKSESSPDIDGKIYFFNKNSSGIWTQTQSVTTNTGSGNSYFGEAIDMAGDWLVVGSPIDGNSQGAHYIFRLNAADVWILADKTAVSYDETISNYGSTVSIVDHSVVGAAIAVGGPTGSGGSVLIYKENQGGAGNWGFVRAIQPSSSVSGFGSSVAIDAKESLSSDVLVVAVGSGPGESARVFDESTLWSEETLFPSSVSEVVGQVVDLDINKNLVAVGVGNEGMVPSPVILYSATTNGIWEEVAAIPVPGAIDFFGANLALNGSTLAIYGYLSNSTGDPPHDFIFLHEEDEGGVGNWGRVDTISQPDLLPSGTNDNEFGNGGLALADEDLLVGAVVDTDASQNVSTPLASGAVYFIPTEPAIYDFVSDTFTVNEGTAGIGDFAVVRTGCTDAAGSIEVAVNPGNVNPATFTEDFSTALILVSFAAGESLASVDLTVIDDAIFEADETVSLTFGDVTGGGSEGITFPTATVTIENDDSIPQISVADLSVAENAGQADFVISVSGESAFDGTVDVVTANGTATSGSDYTARSATINVPAGASSVLASVVIADDAVDELDETFTLTLGNGTNVTIDDSANVGTATITDNDAPSVISIADV